MSAAFRMARLTHASTIFIFIDPLKEIPEEKPPKDCKIVYVSHRPLDPKNTEKTATPLLTLPPIEMTRMGQIKTAVVLALSNKMIRVGDRIVFVTGTPEQGQFDSLVCLDTGKEAEILTTQAVDGLSEGVHPEVFQTVLELALEIASRGREGKPVGTTFVLGDEEKVLQLSRQMIINPFKGYTDKERNILNPKLKETIREFAALDGAFIISTDGLVLAAGRHLGAASDEDSLPRGLGARHIAAAGITTLTGAVAIVISESTGDLRIFKNGKILMEIEKPFHLPSAT